MFRKYLGALLVAPIAAVAFSAPAQAQTGGNIACSKGNDDTGASVCLRSKWTTNASTPKGKVKASAFTVSVQGDVAGLERTAARITNVDLVRPDGRLIWEGPNFYLTRSNTAKTMYPGKYVSPRGIYRVEFKIFDNRGTDSVGVGYVRVD